MENESLNMLMAISMKEIGHKIKKVVKGPILGQMEIFLSENTKIMKNLE